MLLCSTATFKKNSFQTYFNQVSLGHRHLGLTLVQPKGEKKKKNKKKDRPQPAAGMLNFGYSFCHK
jgi:hypothetical protein